MKNRKPKLVYCNTLQHCVLFTGNIEESLGTYHRLCAAVCCSVLQLQCVPYKDLSLSTSTTDSVLQCVAVCCSCSVCHRLESLGNDNRCNTMLLPHVATAILYRTTTHCNKLQHTGNIEETLGTLDYACRAKNIKNTPEINQVRDLTTQHGITHFATWQNIYVHIDSSRVYGLATVSRIPTLIGLFCKIQSLWQGSFAKETYNFKKPANRSQPITKSPQIHQMRNTLHHTASRTSPHSRIYIYVYLDASKVW